jgi:hypothetical protein
MCIYLSYLNSDSAKGYKVRGMARAMLAQWEEAASDLHVASKLDCDEEISTFGALRHGFVSTIFGMVTCQLLIDLLRASIGVSFYLIHKARTCKTAKLRWGLAGGVSSND